MATREEISEFLCEEVLRKCWHKWGVGECIKCGKDFYPMFPEDKSEYPSTTDGIFALIKAGREKDWWEEFEQDCLGDGIRNPTTEFFESINYDNLFNLPTVLYEFLKGREPKECLPCKEKVCTNPEHEGYAT